MPSLSPYYNEGYNSFMDKTPCPYDHLTQYIQYREFWMGRGDAQDAHDG